MLSELLPPLEPDGTSLLWEALGRHFTGMTLPGGRSLSQTNKEFIRALFPGRPDLHLAAARRRCRALIGQVGPETKGVEKMLRRIGFEYAERIDPFDGGPHFIAKTDDITLVKATRTARVVVAARRADDAAAVRARLASSATARRTSPPPARASGSKAPTSACRQTTHRSARRSSPATSVGVLPF